MHSSDTQTRWDRVPNPILCGLLCVLTAGACLAGSSGSPPEGLKVGKLVLAPFAWTSYQVDDNIFRSSNPTADVVNTFGLGTVAVVPFRNSEFDFGFEAIKRAYQVNSFTRDVDIDLNADFIFNFSSFDTVTVRNNYYYGFSDVSRRDFDSGDAVFDGVPFQQLRQDIEILRGVANQKGYYFRAGRTTLRYDEAATQATAFYDFDGLTLSGEYRQPFANYKWLVVYASLRDFDHFRPGAAEIERKEDSSTVQVGLRGRLGRDQPFLLRMGYGTFDYKFPTANPDVELTRSTFQGLTVRANLGLVIGGRTGVDFQLDRRALPSNFNTSYTNTRFQTSFSRPFLKNAWLGVNLRYDDNVYNDPIAGVPSCNGGRPFTRHDQRYGLNTSFDWGISNRLTYRMGVAWDSRKSTCDIYEFDSTVLTIGVSSGW